MFFVLISAGSAAQSPAGAGVLTTTCSEHFQRSLVGTEQEEHTKKHLFNLVKPWATANCGGNDTWKVKYLLPHILDDGATNGKNTSTK